MDDRQFAEHALRIRLGGYTVLPDVLTPGECDEACRELRRILDAESDPAGTELGPGDGWAYTLMNKARVFERTYQHAGLLRVIRHFLGDDCVLSSVQGRVVLPGAPAQSMHFDGSYTGPFRAPAAADEGRRITSHVLGFNALFCLTEFTRANGATRVVPGSHRLATREIPDNHPPGEVIVEAARGSVILFDIALWHGASANTSGEPRYMVSTPWRRSWLRAEADLSRQVRPDVLERAGPEGRAIFGFASRAPYLERWQWDADQGRPKPAWRHLDRDEPPADTGK